MGWGCCLRYLPLAIPGQGHLDHGSAIHGSTALRRRSSYTPIPCLNQLHVRWLLVDHGRVLSGIKLEHGFLQLLTADSFSDGEEH